jgi:hypothetical protein
MRAIVATLRRRACLAALACATAHAIEIYPPDPVQGEQVLFSERYCQGGSPTAVQSATASLGNGTIDVVIDFQAGGFSVPSCARGIVASPPLPAGSFAVRYRTGVDLPPEPTIVTTFQVPAVVFSPQFTGLGGNWFDPASSGTGVNVIQGESGKLFAVWFTYSPFASHGPAAEPVWLVMPAGQWITPTKFRGVMYLTAGSGMNQDWLPNELRVTPAGILTLTFDSSRQARFEAVTLHPNVSTFTKSATFTRFAF